MLISHEAVCFIQVFNDNGAVFWIIIQITVVSLYLKLWLKIKMCLRCGLISTKPLYSQVIICFLPIKFYTVLQFLFWIN